MPEGTEIIIKSGTVSISDGAFSGCTGLTSLTIPNSVTSIGSSAFSYCTGLSSITIPNSVTSIGVEAFFGCTGLTSITCEIETPVDINSWVFYNVDKSTCALYVPFGSKTAYENAAYWNEFENIVEIDSDINAMENAIYIDQVEGRVGRIMDISVKLKNSYPVQAFQFVLELPEGTTVNSWSLSEGRLPSGATVNDKMSTQRIDGNKISVFCTLNYGNATFTGSDGEIAKVNVTFGEDMEEGTYPIYLTACDISSAGGTDEDLSDVKATLILEDYIVGDANGDGKVRIGDATTILNYLAGVSLDNFHAKAADANGDGKLRIGDVTTVLNILTNQ